MWATMLSLVESWSAQHIAALVATAVVTVVLVVGARRRADAWAVSIGRGLAAVIFGAYICEQLTYMLRGDWTAQVNLPLHLTDAVTLASVAALWRPESARLVELVQFWALTASLQAVLTPDLGYGFPDLLFFTYFATHSGAVAAAFLLVFGARRTPRPGAVWRVYAATLAFALLAAAGTLLTGGNYMYLRRKPAHASLLDVMGPWPAYILVAAAFGLLLFLTLAASVRFIAPRSTAGTVTHNDAQIARGDNRYRMSRIATLRSSSSELRLAGEGSTDRRGRENAERVALRAHPRCARIALS